jgi:drug/metabolite transporter (DMT)-like permease
VPAVLAVAYLIFLPGLVCFSVWYRLVETTPLSLMVLTILLQPPLSALIGWWALREKITLPLIVGTSVIIVALIVGSVERRKPQPKGA